MAVVPPSDVKGYADEADLSYGAALEALETQERGAGVVKQLEDELGNSYAGVWFNENQGEFVVPLVGDASGASVASGLAAAQLGGDFRFSHVASSWQELIGAQAKVDSRLEGLLSSGQIQTHLDPRTNSVVIREAQGLEPDDRTTIERVATAQGVSVELDPTNAPSLRIELEACKAEYAICDKPIRGGVRMQKAGSTFGTEGGCTAGFKGTGDVFGNHFILTAGHCYAHGFSEWTSYSVDEAKRYLGFVQASNYPGQDNAAINANGSAYWNNSWGPNVIANWGTNQEYPINNESSSFVGQGGVCHLGSQSGKSCGTVVEMHVSSTDQYGQVLNNLTKFQVVCSIPGDSGGPVFSGNVALGLFTGSDSLGGPNDYCNNAGYYTEITEDTDSLGVHVAPRIPPPPPPPPPPQPPIRAAFADATNSNTLTAWEYGQSGWQQLFLWGHPAAAGTHPLFLKYGGTTHIFFVDAGRGNQVTEWSWSPTLGWQQAFLATDAVASGSSLTGTVVSGSPKIFFSDAATNRSIAALDRSTGSWVQSTFYGDSVAANSSPSAINNNGQAQVFFVDSAKSNTISAWTWGPSSIQQSFLYGDPAAAGTSPSAVYTGSAAQVFFVDSAKSNTISAWTWSPSGIQQSLLSGDSVAAGTSPSAVYNGAAQVFFVDSAKSNIVAVWTWGPSTLQQSFLYGDSAAAGTSPSVTMTSSGALQAFFVDQNTNRALGLWEWGSTLQLTQLFGHSAVTGTSPGT